MPKYTYLLFDADHTLIDFDADERAAFRRTFDAFRIDYTETDIERAWRLSYAVWAQQGLNDVHLPRIQDSFHQKYLSHLPLLFAALSESLPLTAPVETIAERFLMELHAPAHPFGRAQTVFRDLSKDYKTCIATNGLSQMQRARLKEFLPYTHALFISQEMGTIKPHRKFFSLMLSRLHAEPEECLFVGDSLSSDVAGCHDAGIPCLWFNPARRPRPDPFFALGEIADLADLPSYL